MYHQVDIYIGQGRTAKRNVLSSFSCWHPNHERYLRCALFRLWTAWTRALSTNCDWWAPLSGGCCVACKYSFTGTSHIYAFTYCLCPDLVDLVDSDTKNIYSKVLYLKKKVCQFCSRRKQHEGIWILTFFSQPEHNSFCSLIFFLYLDHIFPSPTPVRFSPPSCPSNFKRKPKKKSKTNNNKIIRKRWHK